MSRRPTAETFAAAEQGADYLDKHGQTKAAAAVRAVIEAVPARWTNQGPPALAVHVPVPVHERIQELKEAGKLVLTKEMTLACESYLRGRWLPEAPERAQRGTAPATKSVSARLPQDLLDRVEAYGVKNADRLAQAGWSKPPTARQLCYARLVERFTPKTRQRKAAKPAAEPAE